MTFKRTKCELSESQISWHADEIAIEAAWERTGLKPAWPDDEAGCGVKYANAMADEIARLRLTDEERAAVEEAARMCEEYAEEYDGPDSSPIAATLRSLLARLA